jgi:hypothetical protein
MKRDGRQHDRDLSGLRVLRVYAGRDPLTGKKVWKSRTFQGTKREADRALAAFVTERGVSGAEGVVAQWRARRWRTHTIVRLALKQAVMWGWPADNPAERANPGGTTRPRSSRLPPTTSAACSTPPPRRTTSSSSTPNAIAAAREPSGSRPSSALSAEAQGCCRRRRPESQHDGAVTLVESVVPREVVVPEHCAAAAVAVKRCEPEVG